MAVYQGSLTVKRRPKDGVPGDDGDGIVSTTIEYAKDSSGTTPPTSGWSTSIPSPTAGWYLWTRTTTTYKKSATTIAYSVSYWAKDGEPGSLGLPGQVPIQKEWVVGDTHRFNDEIKDFIYVRGASSDTSYWYTRTSKGDDIVAGSPPVGGANVEGYTRVDWLRTLAVNVLLAEEANLANFIFKDEQLISVRGTVNGVETNYSGQANFKPYIILDGKTGKIYAEGAEISGVINALTGTLGNLTMKSGGAIYLPPTYSSQKGRLDNSGLALIYAGNDSQKIEWYSGLGTIAGQITTTSEGHLKLLSTFGVRIGTEYIGDAISIAMANNFVYHEIDFNSSELKNIRKLSTVGQINMKYTSHVLSANVKYHLANDSTLVIITSAGEGAGIYRITGFDNSNPNNGDIKILTNASSGSRTVHLMSTTPSTATYASNIKVPVTYDGSDFDLHENSSVTLVYFGGYWRVQTDRGQ